MAMDLFSIGKFTVHGYGLMISLGFLAALVYGTWQCKKKGLNDDYFFNLAMFVLIFGWMGGKVLYVIVEFKDFLRSPLSVLGSQGFVVYGGILSGLLTIYLYCKNKKISFAEYIDVMVAAVAINQAMGRVGCFLAGCCYGRETDSAIGVIFPAGSMGPVGVRVLPTQLFMAGGDLLMFVLLVLILNNKRYIKGIAVGVYLTGYAIGRAIIECFRADRRGNVGALSTSQFISIFIAIAGIIVLYFVIKNKDNSAEKAALKEESEGQEDNSSTEENS